MCKKHGFSSILGAQSKVSSSRYVWPSKTFNTDSVGMWHCPHLPLFKAVCTTVTQKGRKEAKNKLATLVLCLADNNLPNSMSSGKGWDTSKSAEFAKHCKVYIPPKQEEVHAVFGLNVSSWTSSSLEVMLAWKIAAYWGKLCELV